MSAEEAAARAREAHGEEQGTLAVARGAVADLEQRVAAGDHEVSAVDLLEARHQVEVGERRLAHLHAAALSAEEAHTLAKAHELVDSWEAAAPVLRAEIRKAAEALIEAQAAIEEACSQYNAAAAAVRQGLQHVKDPGNRWNTGAFAAGVVGSETLRRVEPAIVIEASLARHSQAHRDARVFLPPGVLPDTIPVLAPNVRPATVLGSGPLPDWDARNGPNRPLDIARPAPPLPMTGLIEGT